MSAHHGPGTSGGQGSSSGGIGEFSKKKSSLNANIMSEIHNSRMNDAQENSYFNPGQNG